MNRKNWLIFILLPVIILFYQVNAAPASAAGEELPKIIMGFYTEDYPGDKLSYNSLKANGQLIDQVATFDYQVNSSGGLVGNVSADALKLAKSKGAKTIMLIHNIHGSIDCASAYSAIANKANRARLIGNMMNSVNKYGFDGVNIDLEGIPAYGRESYNAFLAELSKNLGSKMLTVCVPAKTSDDPGNSWTGAYNYKYIGNVADYIVIMSYDQHWFGGSAGPVASLPWVTKVLDYSVKAAPAGKILMGIGCYGYDWTAPGKGKAVKWRSMPGLINQYGNVQWDNYNNVPHQIYWKNGVRHNVWFENSYSLAIKLNLVNKYNLAGIAFWRMGFEDQTFWNTVKAKFNWLSGWL